MRTLISVGMNSCFLGRRSKVWDQKPRVNKDLEKIELVINVLELQATFGTPMAEDSAGPRRATWTPRGAVFAP